MINYSAHIENLVSRFIEITDPQEKQFIFNLPNHYHWYSRPYEYAWASGFASPDDVVLDAACGLCHPLKFYLAKKCRETHACDIDERILSSDLILEDVAKVFGIEEVKMIESEYIHGITFRHCAIINMPYEDETFDKIFCISVLEHLKDSFNKFPMIYSFRKFLSPFLPYDIFLALSEFKRVLKANGKIMLTFDYPRINLEYFSKITNSIGLKFAGPVFYEIPTTAVFSKEQKLYCFRAVLENKD